MRCSQARGLRTIDAGAGEFDTRLDWRGSHVESRGSRVDFGLCLIVFVFDSQILQLSVEH